MHGELVDYLHERRGIETNAANFHNALPPALICSAFVGFVNATAGNVIHNRTGPGALSFTLSQAAPKNASRYPDPCDGPLR